MHPTVDHFCTTSLRERSLLYYRHGESIIIILSVHINTLSYMYIRIENIKIESLSSCCSEIAIDRRAQTFQMANNNAMNEVVRHPVIRDQVISKDDDWTNRE